MPRARLTALVLVGVVLAVLVCPAVANAATAVGPTTAGGLSESPPADAPAGTVGQAGEFLVDGEGRALLLHGVTLPAARTTTDDELDAWVLAGLSAVRLTVTVDANGGLLGVGAPPGLGGLVAAVERYTDRGFRVAVRLSPARADTVVSQPANVAAIESVATALRDVPGLVGFEVAVAGSVDPTALPAAVRRNDPYHLLWRELPASIDPAATVAAAGDAGYLVSWGDGTLATTRRIVAAAEAATTGWFYDLATIGTVLTEVIRPYPVAVAGTPTEFGVAADGSFTLTYRTEPPAGGTGALAPGTASAVVLPATIYQDGYTATVTGGEVTSAPGAPVLCVVAAAGVGSVSVSVAAGAGAAGAAGAGGTAGAGGAGVPVAGARTATSCEAPRPPAASDTAAPTGAGAGADGTVEAASEAASDEGDDLALLVLFPLLGAVATALLVGGAVLLVRPRRSA